MPRAILSNNNTVGGIILSDFKTCCKAVIIKTVLYCHRNRHNRPINRIENLEIHPCIYRKIRIT